MIKNKTKTLKKLVIENQVKTTMERNKKNDELYNINLCISIVILV